MDIEHATPLLAGMSAQTFMQQYWQKKPLLVRQAMPHFVPLLDRKALFDLASRDDAQARLVVSKRPGVAWRLAHGPFHRRALPPLKQPGWTLLVQGVDLLHDAAHQWLAPFRFVPDARLDDLMISYASDGGGVGPHVDSYDVFLLQAQGQRRWRIGRQKDLRLQPDVPLKILAHFEAEAEYILAPGDMLYLPPLYAHEGVALGACMTYSIGFRAPSRAELARELLQRLADTAAASIGPDLYADPNQAALSQPAQIPPALQAFAAKAVHAALQEPQALARALGEYLSEPKANVWFDADDELAADLDGGVRLDRRTKMLFDAKHVFINGESVAAAPSDVPDLQQLANQRYLAASQWRQLSPGLRDLLQSWRQSGWLHGGALE
jgi:50S ribosomal protein L16 3-hydroxylase